MDLIQIMWPNPAVVNFHPQTFTVHVVLHARLGTSKASSVTIAMNVCLKQEDLLWTLTCSRVNDSVQMLSFAVKFPQFTTLVCISCRLCSTKVW